MSLRYKILLFCCVGLLALTSSLFYIAKKILLANYAQTELQDIEKHTLQVKELIAQRLNSLDTSCHDWASWDDTYAFIEDNNEEYRKANLLLDTFSRIGANLVAYVHRSGKIVYARWFDFTNKSSAPLPADFCALLRPGQPLMRHSPENPARKGVLQSPWGLLLIVARPILPSNEKGPSRGTLIFGRLLNDKELEPIRRATHLHIQLWPLYSLAPSDQSLFLSLMNKKKPYCQWEEQDIIAAYSFLYDPEGQPVAVLRVADGRRLLLQAQEAVKNMSTLIVIFSLGFILFFLLILEQGMLKRLAKLKKELAAISAQANPAARIRLTGNDELGDLARHLNLTLEALQASQEQLREQEALYRTLVETIPDWIWEIDENAVYTYASPRVKEILGYAPEEIVGKTPWEFMPPEEATRVKSEIELLAPRGAPIRHLQIRRFKKNGEEIITETNGVPILDRGGRVCGYRGVARDITERKRAEEALAAEKERLRVTLRCIGDAVVATDIDCRITVFNKIAEMLTGWKENEVLGRPLEEILRIVHQDTREPLPCPLKHALEQQKIAASLEKAVLIARDGTEHLIADSAAPIFDQESRIIGAVMAFRDISLQTRLQEEADKAMRLESLGLLASGIAHDFNNLLAGIMSNVQLAELLPLNSAEQKQALQAAQSACQRAAELTQKLLTFAKGGEPIKKIIALEPLVREHLELALAGSPVRLDFQAQEPLPYVEVDPAQIGQVVQNLAINAVQAMPLGGCLHVSLQMRSASELCADCRQPEPHIALVIKDEGHGIPPEHLPRIFDPYFTTKQQGSGLGLAIAHSIIIRHGGHIAVSSHVGQGATFTICLPALTEQTAPAAPAPKPTELAYGSGRLLLMDDEPALREVAQLTLQRLGYEVCSVEEGAAAIQAYQQALEEGRPFDLVILDLTVRGGMGGLEAMRHLQQLDPLVRVIVCSGYSADAVMQNYRDYGFLAGIVKPYDIRKLAQIVKEVLTAPPLATEAPKTQAPAA